MPKTTITYRIFIGSPSDITEERSIIHAVAEELNRSTLIQNLKLEVIDWENATYPSIGVDAQDVINNQISDDYDIFIGVFWQKFGTATKRDQSGTKEEFERAYARYSNNSNSVNILMYFKDTPVSISEIDIDQIGKIAEFKKDLESRGVLYSKFSQSNEFEKFVRSHLSLLLNKLSNKLENEVENSQNENSVIILAKSTDEDEEQGYLELVDIATQDMLKLTPEVVKITKQMSDLESRMKKKTVKLNSLKGMPQNIVNKESRKLLDGLANDIEIFNKNVRPIIPTMTDLFNNSMNNFNKAILIHKKYLNDQQGLINSLSGLQYLRNGVIGAHDGIYGLRDVVKEFPPFTNKILKSKKEIISVIGNILDEFNSYINIIDNLITIIIDD